MSERDVTRKDEYLLPVVKRWFKEEPLVIVEGKGAILKDSRGREYIDLFGLHSAASQGHCHPRVVQAVKQQAEKLMHLTYDYHNTLAAGLAEKLVAIVPEGLRKVYFLNSGSEAVECAIYVSRKFAGKSEIIGLYGAFHGRTYGARTMIGWAKYKQGGGPYLPGITHMPSYYCYRCTLGLEYPSCNLQCAKMLEDVLRYQTCGTVAAFIAEPVLASAGNIPAPDGYFKEIKKILDQNEILFIDDEVITGFGRTGKMFAIEQHGLKPDIMTMAKALGGGVPISAVACTEKVANALKPMDYFSTYGGNPLCCAAAIAAVQVLTEEKLIDRSRELGEYFLKRLGEIAQKHELIGDVRGKGLLIGVELVKNRKTKEPAVEESLRIRDEARKKGVLLPAGWGWLGNVVRLAPPLVITSEQLDKSIEVFEESLKIVEKKN